MQTGMGRKQHNSTSPPAPCCPGAGGYRLSVPGSGSLGQIVSLVLAGRGVARGVQPRDAVGLPVRRVAAAVDRDDRGRDPFLQLLDLEATLHFFLRVHGKHSSRMGQGGPVAASANRTGGRPGTGTPELLAAGRVAVARGATGGTGPALAGGARGVAARRNPLLEPLELEAPRPLHRGRNWAGVLRAWFHDGQLLRRGSEASLGR